MTKSKFISPLTWPCGKAKQWKLLKSYFPKNTKNMKYIEPFFGGGRVGLNALNSQIVTYNEKETNKNKNNCLKLTNYTKIIKGFYNLIN